MLSAMGLIVGGSRWVERTQVARRGRGRGREVSDGIVVRQDGE